VFARGLAGEEKESAVMSRKTPVSADVGNSAGYWGAIGDGAGRELS